MSFASASAENAVTRTYHSLTLNAGLEADPNTKFRPVDLNVRGGGIFDKNVVVCGNIDVGDFLNGNINGNIFTNNIMAANITEGITIVGNLTIDPEFVLNANVISVNTITNNNNNSDDLVIQATDMVILNATDVAVTGNVVPATSNTFCLGTSTMQWGKVYTHDLIATGNVVANIMNMNMMGNLAQADVLCANIEVQTDRIVSKTSGTGGTVLLDGDLNLNSGDLNNVTNITATSGGTGDLTICGNIELKGGDVIIDQNLDLSGGDIHNVNSINGSNGSVAIEGVTFNNASISNVNSITGNALTSNVEVCANIEMKPGSTINMNGGNITNVTNISTTSTGGNVNVSGNLDMMCGEIFNLQTLRTNDIFSKDGGDINIVNDVTLQGDITFNTPGNEGDVLTFTGGMWQSNPAESGVDANLVISNIFCANTRVEVDKITSKTPSANICIDGNVVVTDTLFVGQIGGNSPVSFIDELNITSEGMRIIFEDGIVIGNGNTTTLFGNAISIGKGTTASAPESIAIGGNSTASGTSSIAIGKEASTQEEFGISIGNDAIVTTTKGISLGANAVSGFTDPSETEVSSLPVGPFQDNVAGTDGRYISFTVVESFRLSAIRVLTGTMIGSLTVELYSGLMTTAGTGTLTLINSMSVNPVAPSYLVDYSSFEITLDPGVYTFGIAASGVIRTWSRTGTQDLVNFPCFQFAGSGSAQVMPGTWFFEVISLELSTTKAIVIGCDSSALGEESIVIGANSMSSIDNSIVLGGNVIASSSDRALVLKLNTNSIITTGVPRIQCVVNGDDYEIPLSVANLEGGNIIAEEVCANARVITDNIEPKGLEGNVRMSGNIIITDTLFVSNIVGNSPVVINDDIIVMGNITATGVLSSSDTFGVSAGLGLTGGGSTSLGSSIALSFSDYHEFDVSFTSDGSNQILFTISNTDPAGSFLGDQLFRVGNNLGTCLVARYMILGRQSTPQDSWRSDTGTLTVGIASGVLTDNSLGATDTNGRGSGYNLTFNLENSNNDAVLRYSVPTIGGSNTVVKFKMWYTLQVTP